MNTATLGLDSALDVSGTTIGSDTRSILREALAKGVISLALLGGLGTVANPATIEATGSERNPAIYARDSLTRSATLREQGWAYLRRLALRAWPQQPRFDDDEDSLTEPTDPSIWEGLPVARDA